MAIKSYSGTVVQLPLSETDQVRLDTWAVEIATDLRPNAPQAIGSEDEIRIGRRGSLALYADGHWVDYEADEYGPGAFSFILHDLNGDLAAATRFAAEWLRTYRGNGSREPHQTASVEAENRAKLHAALAQQVLDQVAPLPGTTSAAYLTSRGQHGPYSDALLGHLERYRAHECAIVARLTDAKGMTLGIQVGHLTLDARKSGSTPLRQLFWIPLDQEQRRAGLFRPAPAALPAGSDKDAELVDVTLLVEGLENTLSVAAAFPCATVLGLPGIGRARHIPPIRGAVIFVRDGDEPGSQADKSLTRGIDHLLLTGTKTVRVTETPLGADGNSILQSGGVEALRTLIRAAKPAALSLDGEALRLAKIRDPLQFDLERKAVATARGVRKSSIDAAVAAKRKMMGDTLTAPGDNGDKLGPIPWPEPVTDIAEVLDTASKEIASYVIASRAVRDTTAMWGLFTHFVHHPAITFMIGARLAICAVSPQSGKTTLLSATQQLAYRPMPAASLTQALVNRVIDQYRPTLLIDEADKLLRANRNPELIALLNASHNRRYAEVPRLVPTSDGGWEVAMFSAWHVHACTMNGKLDDQQQSRSIAVTVRRAKPAELTALRQRIRERRKEKQFKDGVSVLLLECGRKFARWAADQLAVPDDVDLPDEVDFRDHDNWMPLFQLAALVGGDWPARVRDAALAVNGVTRAIGDVVPLLEDIREVFGEKDRLTTDQLVQGMLGLPEPSADWQAANRGRPINVYFLRERLKGLVDAPRSERRWSSGAVDQRGYLRLHFAEAFERYLPSEVEAGSEPPDGAFSSIEAHPPKSLGGSGGTARIEHISTAYGTNLPTDAYDVGSDVAASASVSDNASSVPADTHDAPPVQRSNPSDGGSSLQHIETDRVSSPPSDASDFLGARVPLREELETRTGSNDNAATPPNGEERPPVAESVAGDSDPPSAADGILLLLGRPRRHPEWRE